MTKIITDAGSLKKNQTSCEPLLNSQNQDAAGKCSISTSCVGQLGGISLAEATSVSCVYVPHRALPHIPLVRCSAFQV